MSSALGTSSEPPLEPSPTLGLGTGRDPLGPIEKGRLVDSRGRRYDEVRATLTPRFGTLWLQILLGHAALIAVVASLWRIEAHLGPWRILLALPGALCLGYAVAYLHLFTHEAAHFNLAPNRKLNDGLSDLFLGSLIGLDTARYRVIHFDHHRHLGTVKDTERTYFSPLTPRFLVELLTGLRVLRVLAGRKQRLEQQSGAKAPRLGRQLLCSLALHGVVIGGALLEHRITLLVAWLLGFGLVFPFFAGLRQILEHRSESAGPEIDYAAVDHGPCNRLFGRGPLASTFGAAGFNRHALHHWDPQVSCTRLAELEAYLMDTEAGPAIAQRRTTYLRTFLELVRDARTRG